MEPGGILLRREIAFALLCQDVDNHRMVQFFRFLEHLAQLLDVVAVHRNNQLLDSLFGAADFVDDLFAQHRYFLQGAGDVFL